MISKSFFKSSIIFTIGGSLSMIAGLILLPFYTNFLSEDQYTQLLFYISMSLLFQILFSFSIESYFGIKYTQLSESPNDQKRFIGTVSILQLSIGVLLVIVTAIFGDMLFKVVYKDNLGMEFWPYGFYSVLTGFFNSYFKTSSICLIYLKQPKLFLSSNLTNFIFTLLISILGLFVFPNTIIGPIYGRLLSGFIIFLIGHYIFIKNGILKLDTAFLDELIKFCRPFLLYVLFIWVLGQIDRYFLQAYIPKSQLNAYDLILKCFFGIEFIQNSLFGVISPKLFEIWNKNQKLETTQESNRYFNVLTAINIIQLILFCLLIPLVYKLIVKNALFYQSEVYVGILAAGYALKSIHLFYLSTILFSKKINILLKIFGLSAVIQIVITLFAIKHFGLNGAIYAGLITKILQVVFCMYFTRSIFHYNFNYFKIILLPLIYVLINLVQFLIFHQYHLWIYLAQLIIFTVVFYIVFKNEIKKVMLSFKLISA
jgi:O-antigen/teichoic acid export membrane protein